MEDENKKRYDALIKEIKVEIEKLSDKSYRESEQVWMTPKELKLLKRLFNEAKNLRERSVMSFCRLVTDSASSDSKIKSLSGKLFELSQQ